LIFFLTSFSRCKTAIGGFVQHDWLHEIPGLFLWQRYTVNIASVFSCSVRFFAGLFLCALAFSCQSQNREFEIILRGGTVYDGTGGPSFPADVAINADTIAAIGDLSSAKGKTEWNVKGLAVAPGFINMLSWADGSLLQDPRSMSDLKQGVTLEVFGEGWSPGPRKDSTATAPWKTLGEYFNYLQKKGSTPNVASFVGATSIRSLVIGLDNRKPTEEELEQMKMLVRQAMEEGAMGVGSSLIYAPADYASTEELIALCKVASSYGGMYITHMRSESDRILQAMNETFRIAQEASIPAEIYHLKINQVWNWNKIDTVITKIDSARNAGLRITADMYTYDASGTGLSSRLPTWVQNGGAAAMRARLKNPAIRKKVLDELASGIPTKNSDPHRVMLLGFRKDSLNKLYRNKRLDDVAKHHGKNADETMIDLIVADKSNIPAIFFLISEQNVQRMIQLPYVSFCSDAGSVAAEKPFINSGTHPRAYGSFARLLAKYVRDEKLLTLEEAIRRLTSWPASNLKIAERGVLRAGFFADVVVFNPQTIQDHATFDNPHRYASGVEFVFVNGNLVLKNGLHTGVFPGRVIRGPGWKATK
jgi:N-acyl-D-amino-acid deacylase